jgi:hypothetical protein
LLMGMLDPPRNYQHSFNIYYLNFSDVVGNFLNKDKDFFTCFVELNYLRPMNATKLGCILCGDVFKFRDHQHAITCEDKGRIHMYGYSCEKCFQKGAHVCRICLRKVEVCEHLRKKIMDTLSLCLLHSHIPKDMRMYISKMHVSHYYCSLIDH